MKYISIIPYHYEIGNEASILINEYKSTKYTDNNIDHVLKLTYNSCSNYHKSTEIQIKASNIYIETYYLNC